MIKAPAGSTGNNGGDIYGGYYSMGRKAIEDFWYCNNSLYYWEKASTSDAVKYLWVEQDGGTIGTVETTLKYTVGGVETTTKITFTVGNDDDQIGDPFTMNFALCPSEGYYVISGGSAEFRWLLENRP